MESQEPRLDSNGKDIGFILDKLHPAVKLITDRKEIYDFELAIKRDCIILVAKYRAARKEHTYIGFKITPDITNIDNITSNKNLLNAFLGDTKEKVIADIDNDLYENLDGIHLIDARLRPAQDLTEEELKVYFTEVTTDIMDYFKNSTLNE